MSANTEPELEINIRGKEVDLTADVKGWQVWWLVQLLSRLSTTYGGEGIQADAIEEELAKESEFGWISIRQFMEEVAPENNHERVAAIALYHEEVLGESDGVQVVDLMEWFLLAGGVPPRNLSQAIVGAEKMGLISETEVPGYETAFCRPTWKAHRELLG